MVGPAAGYKQFSPTDVRGQINGGRYRRPVESLRFDQILNRGRFRLIECVLGLGEAGRDVLAVDVDEQIYKFG